MKVIRNEACPKCGSKDNVAVYQDGHRHCFSQDCGYHTFGDKQGKTINRKGKDEDISILPLPKKEMPALKARGIDSSTINKYKVTVNLNPESTIEAVFPRFSLANEHVSNQIRRQDKQFSQEGSYDESGLFGRNAFPPGGRSITVTEGYYDTLSSFQLTGSRYPNVGVMSAATAKTEIVRDFEYLDSFSEIVLAFDADKPGQDAAKICANLFAPGKVRILKLEKGKDANEYLQNGLIKEFINEWHRAPVFLPDGLLTGNSEELLTDIIDYKEPESVPYPWEGLNHSTYGMRLGEMTLFLADTGIGKTTFMKECEYKLLTDPELIRREYGIGFLHLEESKRDTAIGMMSIHKNKPYHLPDTARTRQELIDVYEELIKTDRVVIWDAFGSNDVDVVLSKIRHMAAMGCRYIFLDHLSIVVSDQSGDERKQLDEISTKLKTLTMNLNICVVCVMHINRQGQARGSAGPEQVANVVVRLERNKRETDEWRRNVTRMVVEKCRLSGRTGPSAWVFYNPVTCRLEELNKEQIDRFESGASNAGHEFDSMAA